MAYFSTLDLCWTGWEMRWNTCIFDMLIRFELQAKFTLRMCGGLYWIWDKEMCSVVLGLGPTNTQTVLAWGSKCSFSFYSLLQVGGRNKIVFNLDCMKIQISKFKSTVCSTVCRRFFPHSESRWGAIRETPVSSSAPVCVNPALNPINNVHSCFNWVSSIFPFCLFHLYLT